MLLWIGIWLKSSPVSIVCMYQVLKVRPRDTSKENQFTLRWENSRILHTLSLSLFSHFTLRQRGGNRGLYTYFGCLPSLDPLSPLPPTALPQRVISSLSLLSHLISQPSVIAPQIHPSPQEKPSTREETLKHRKNK